MMVCYFVAPSLDKRKGLNLLFLLGLARAVPHVSSSMGLKTIFYYPNF
jgi:hypothetical protein